LRSGKLGNVGELLLACRNAGLNEGVAMELYASTIGPALRKSGQAREDFTAHNTRDALEANAVPKKQWWA